MPRLLIFFMAAFLGGCLSAKDVAGWSTSDVASSYGDTAGNPLTDHRIYEEELRSRNVFSEAQWERIRRREIQPGDTSEFVRAAWGRPDDSLATKSAEGSMTVWSYRNNAVKPGAHGDVFFVGNQVYSITQ